MEFKMYAFGEDGVPCYICATSEEQAIGIYKKQFGEETWNDEIEAHGTQHEFIRQMDMDEVFIYYHDGKTPEEAYIKNHIKKYCSESKLFAVSDY